MIRTFIGGVAVLAISASAFSDTIIKSGTVAPFNLCFIKGNANWEGQYLGQDANLVNGSAQHSGTPKCYDQTTSVSDFMAMSTFEKDAFSALAFWQYYWRTSKPAQVNIQTDSTSPRFGGESVDGATVPYIYTDSSGTSSISVVEPAALTLMKGGDVLGTRHALHNAVNVLNKKRSKITVSKIKGTSGTAQINVYINQAYGLKTYCFDQTPTLQGQPSCGFPGTTQIWDVVSVLTHELGHGFGFWSRRYNPYSSSQTDFGEFQNNTINQFDFWTNNKLLSGRPAAGGSFCANAQETKFYSCNFMQDYNSYFKGNQHLILFSGANTVKYLTGKYTPPNSGTGWNSSEYKATKVAPLADALTFGAAICNLPMPCGNCTRGSGIGSQNFSHFSTEPQATPAKNPVTTDLMSLWSLWSGGRLGVSTLDLNVMSDMGYPLKTSQALSNDDIRSTIFNNATLKKAIAAKAKAAKK